MGRSILAYLGLVFSLGWLMPVVNTRLTSYLMNHTWFGSEKVSFNAKAKPLYRFFLIFAGVSLLFGFAFGLIVPSTLAGMNEQTAQEGTKTIMPFVFFMAIYVVSGVLFLSLLQWYNGNELRHFLNHTRLGSLQLRCTMTGGQYARLFLVNLLTVVFTLGLGMPWVYMRYLRLMETTLSLEGTIDYAALAQGAHERPTVGEGLADAFDVGGL